jgi:hypothetical protein
VVYRVLADLVVVVHLAFIAFVAVGAVMAWRWPRLVRVHVPAVVWAAAIVGIGFTCPLTPLEKAFRRRAGGTTYQGGFIDHYLTGVIYPGRYLGLARALVLLLIVVGYAGLVLRWRSAKLRSHVGDEVEGGHDRRVEGTVRLLPHVTVPDLGVPEAHHVEGEAVTGRGRHVVRGDTDVLEDHLEVDALVGAGLGDVQRHLADRRALRASNHQLG